MMKNSQSDSNTNKMAINNSESIQFQSSKGTKDILIDFAIVYLLVPLWITLLAAQLKHLRDQYMWMPSCIVDLVLLATVFVLVAIPLHYLRLQASTPSHFLHKFRIETTEIFMDETRSQAAPALFDWDIIILASVVVSYTLVDPFQDLFLSDIPFFSLYFQSFTVLSVYDAGTYWLHRMLHHPKWYKYHKQHHEVRNSVALKVHHIGTVDTLLSILPLFLLPVMYQVCGMAMTREVWIMGSAFMQAQLYISHCDLYLFSTRWSLGLFWGESAICHSNHHFKNNGNFGPVSPLIWDWICNTRYQPRVHQQ